MCISVNFTYSTTSSIASNFSAEHQPHLHREENQQVSHNLSSNDTAADQVRVPSQLHTQLLPHSNFTFTPPLPLPQAAPFTDIPLSISSVALFPSPACSHRPATHPIHQPQTSPLPTPGASLTLLPSPITLAPLPPGRPQPGSAPPGPSPGLPPAAPGRRPSSPLTAGSAPTSHPVFPGAAVPSRKGSGCSRGPARSVPRAAAKQRAPPATSPGAAAPGSEARARRSGSGRAGLRSGGGGRGLAGAAVPGPRHEEQRRGAGRAHRAAGRTLAAGAGGRPCPTRSAASRRRGSGRPGGRLGRGGARAAREGPRAARRPHAQPPSRQCSRVGGCFTGESLSVGYCCSE